MHGDSSHDSHSRHDCYDVSVLHWDWGLAHAQVYPAEGPSKPDMGEGLNKPAEISLYKIVKRDAKGHVIKQGEEFQKFVQKLKLMASRQSTEFISYDEEREIWKFRVEHFSRCSPVKHR